MRILIDTQVFVWLCTAHPRIGRAAMALLADSSNSLHMSYFSLLELTIKASIGKLTLDSTVFDDLTAMGIELIMPDKKVLAGYKIFAANNKDPFDNLLLTAAQNEQCYLMTSDQKILALADKLKLIDATK